MNTPVRTLCGCAFLALLLSGCGGGGGGSNPDAPGCVDVPGEPDLLGPLLFDPATASPGDIVHLKMPVDEDVSFVTVVLSFDSNVLIGGFTDPTYVVPAPGTQTLSVPIQINPNVAAGRFTVDQIHLCTVDTGTCEGASGSGGVGVFYLDGVPASDGEDHMLRGRFFSNGGPENVSGSLSCIVQPVLTIE